MADTPRVPDFTEMADTPADADVLYIINTAGGADRKITYATLRGPVSLKSADYTITKNNEKVFCTGNCTVTLPPASYGWEEHIANQGTGVVTVQRAGADTIEGEASILLSTQYAAASLKGNGDALWIEF